MGDDTEWIACCGTSQIAKEANEAICCGNSAFPYSFGGSDPYEWLERVLGRLVHVHAKDISLEQGAAERGKVTGTPVGCACGDGVVDWQRVIDILKPAAQDNDIILSVECGTIPQAERSFAYLSELL